MASPETTNRDGEEKLYLADWRRRVADLYAEVRHLSEADPQAAHVLWQKAREALYRGHPSSPVPAELRPEFRSLHFAYDPGFRFELTLIADETEAVDPAARSGGSPPLSRFGAVEGDLEHSRLLAEAHESAARERPSPRPTVSRTSTGTLRFSTR